MICEVNCFRCRSCFLYADNSCKLGLLSGHKNSPINQNVGTLYAVGFYTAYYFTAAFYIDNSLMISKGNLVLSLAGNYFYMVCDVSCGAPFL